MTTTDQPLNPNKALWEKGDFTQIAAGMRESGEALVNSLGITDGLEVLDLGSGDGTTAIPGRDSGADVSASISPKTWWPRGTRGPYAAGLTNCRFEEGDAPDLDASPTSPSIWSSVSLARCSRQSPTWRERWSASRSPVVGS